MDFLWLFHTNSNWSPGPYANFDSAVVRIILILPQIAILSVFFFKDTTTISITITFVFPNIFSPLVFSNLIALFFHSLITCSNKIHSNDNFLFCLLINTMFWPGFGIHFYFKVPENFMGPHFLNRFSFMHIPFVIMAKF